jgi:hypothetical protein
MTQIVEEQNIIIKKSEQISNNISVSLTSYTDFEKNSVKYKVSIEDRDGEEIKKIEFVPSEWMNPGMFFDRAKIIAKGLRG